MAGSRTKAASAHFKTMVQSDVPQGRNGKHKEIVSIILDDLDQLKAGAAIKVPRDDRGAALLASEGAIQAKLAILAADGQGLDGGHAAISARSSGWGTPKIQPSRT